MTGGTRSDEHTEFNIRELDALGVRFGGLATDSRKIRPNDLFLAYPGSHTDGRAYIVQAMAAGASAVLWEQSGFHWNTDWRVADFGVAEFRSRVGGIASRLF